MPGPWLPLPSGLNLRDVGGLPVGAGGMTRSGVLLRSGSLRLLSTTDADRLRTEFDLRTVVDLRTSAEVAADGPSLLAGAGLATAHLPLIDNIHRDLRDAQRRADPVRMLAGAYQQFVSRRGEHIATAARLLAWSTEGALLVHCSAGKDRTGVTVAILLEAVGVARESVLADYAMTNDVIEEVLRTLERTADRGLGLASIPLAMRRAQPDALRAVLDDLDRGWGGAAGWLRAKGLEPAELKRLRSRLVAPPHAA